MCCSHVKNTCQIRSWFCTWYLIVLCAKLWSRKNKLFIFYFCMLNGNQANPPWIFLWPRFINLTTYHPMNSMSIGWNYLPSANRRQLSDSAITARVNPISELLSSGPPCGCFFEATPDKLEFVTRTYLMCNIEIHICQITYWMRKERSTMKEGYFFKPCVE